MSLPSAVKSICSWSLTLAETPDAFGSSAGREATPASPSARPHRAARAVHRERGFIGLLLLESSRCSAGVPAGSHAYIDPGRAPVRKENRESPAGLTPG